MPMKTFKGIKNNKIPKLRKNVKKGTANKLNNEIMKQNLGETQRWETLKSKYSADERSND